MRGFRISSHGGPEALEWAELPDPRPGAGEALVAVRACALNHLDLWVRNGVEGVRYPLPLVPGSEIAGDVIEIGEPRCAASAGRRGPGGARRLVRHLRTLSGGRGPSLPRVRHPRREHRDGGYAERVAVPGRNLLPLPRGLAFSEAAAVPLAFLTAWHMLVDARRLRPHETSWFTPPARGSPPPRSRSRGCSAPGASSPPPASAAKLERARALGATDTIDYRGRTSPFAPARSSAASGVDVVLDHVGGEVFEKSLKAARPRRPHRALRRHRRAPRADQPARGLLQEPVDPRLDHGQPARAQAPPPPLRARRAAAGGGGDLPLSELASAHQALARREQFGKIVLTVGREDT